eukprot:scaffold108_cov162-Amphora_coffeaeformis.AAC.1
MAPNKKRSAADMVFDEEDPLDTIARLQAENENDEKEELKAKMQQLETKLSAYEKAENSDDYEDDDDSVCDGSPWSKTFQVLKEYKQQHGHCNVPQKQKPLGVWVKNQRYLYVQKKLSQNQIDKLEKIGFHWGKNYPAPKTWDDMLEELIKHKKTFGHCNVAINDDPARRNPLSKWVVEQRKQGKCFRRQMPTHMTLQQFERLNEVSFLWKLPKKSKA